MSRSNGRLKYLSLILILLSVFCGGYNWTDGREAFAEQIGLSIENVRIDKIVLSPDDPANISFFVTRDANVSIFVYDPDFAVVKTLMSNLGKKAGTISVAWNGTDDSGKLVPDEAYLVGIVAEGSDGQKAVYDSTAYSGGEILDVKVDRVEESQGGYNIYYSLSQAARVSLKAGIHEGPLLKTIVDWQPQPPGNYMMTWDGMDEADQISVMDAPGALIDIRGFSLPEGTIIVRGSSGDYFAYHRSLKPAVTSGDVSYKRARENVLKRSGENISQQYLVPRILNVAPNFMVYLEGDRSSPLADRSSLNVSGQVGLVIEVGTESLPSFNESRYEIIVFIDNRRFDEEEQAYAPYTYVLDTNRLENGEHWISINLASITGQVGSYSFKLNVNN